MHFSHSASGISIHLTIEEACTAVRVKPTPSVWSEGEVSIKVDDAEAAVIQLAAAIVRAKQQALEEALNLAERIAKSPVH